jgi:hypothetical protein
MRVVAVHVMMMVIVRGRVGLLGEPALHVGDFAFRIVEPAVDQLRHACADRLDDRRGRIERGEPRTQARQCIAPFG